MRSRRRRQLAERAPRSRASEIAWPADAPARAKLLTYSFEGKLAYVPAAKSHEVRMQYCRDGWIFADTSFPSQEALEAALAVFPSLSHVRRKRIQLHVRFSNPDAEGQPLVEVAVSPDAWSELVRSLDPVILRRD